MASGPNSHDIQLTANLNGNTVTVTGNGDATLLQGSGNHRFNFTLADPTGLNVRFTGLDTADNCETCPPPPGQNSSQIVGVTMHNNGPNNNSAGFTDNNNNHGAMNVSYQWNFTCDDADKTVNPFDPIIINGGA